MSHLNEVTRSQSVGESLFHPGMSASARPMAPCKGFWPPVPRPPSIRCCLKPRIWPLEAPAADWSLGWWRHAKTQDTCSVSCLANFSLCPASSPRTIWKQLARSSRLCQRQSSARRFAFCWGRQRRRLEGIWQCLRHYLPRSCQFHPPRRLQASKKCLLAPRGPERLTLFLETPRMTNIQKLNHGLLGIQLNKPTLANPGHTKSQILNIRWLWTMEWTLCVCVLPSYTGHGVWWHLYKPHADLHGLMYCTFRFARGPSRPSLSQCVPAHFGWNCWTRFSTAVFLQQGFAFLLASVRQNQTGTSFNFQNQSNVFMSARLI